MTVHQLIARGVQKVVENDGVQKAIQNMPDLRDGNNEPIKIKVPTWGVFMLVGTFILYMIVHLSISYTYGVLVPTLVMSEAPSTTTVIKTAEYHDDVDEDPDAPLLTKEEKESALPQDEEILVIAHNPITAKFRTTIRHLRQVTGSRLSRFRGVGGYVFYKFTATAVAANATTLLGPRVGSMLAVPLTAMFCVWSAAWVQQAVAMPGKSYYQRAKQLYRVGAFRKLFGPTMIVEVAQLCIFSLPQNVAVDMSFATARERDAHPAVFGAIAALVVFFTLIGITCVVIPLNIGLVRYQVSLLAEEEETVVPVDRSLGNAQVVGIMAGWKSFSRRSLVTLIKTFVKCIAMQSALALLFLGVVFGEVYLFMGPQFQKFAAGLKNMQRQQ